MPAGAAEGLETDFRPHFFGGVATVCAKLFLQVAPDIAVFGEKDFQQLAVIRQMVRDLDLPLAIVGAPTMREADGLAMSSRNRYLSADETPDRAARPSGDHGGRGAGAGGRRRRAACADAAGTLTAGGFRSVDYVAVRDAATLSAFDPAKGAGRVLVAAWLGKTRLIDNVPSEGHSDPAAASSRLAEAEGQRDAAQQDLVAVLEERVLQDLAIDLDGIGGRAIGRLIVELEGAAVAQRQ